MFPSSTHYHQDCIFTMNYVWVFFTMHISACTTNWSNFTWHRNVGNDITLIHAVFSCYSETSWQVTLIAVAVPWCNFCPYGNKWVRLPSASSLEGDCHILYTVNTQRHSYYYSNFHNLVILVIICNHLVFGVFNFLYSFNF